MVKEIVITEPDFTGFKLTQPPASPGFARVLSVSLGAASPVQLKTDVAWNVVFAVGFHQSEVLCHEPWIICDGLELSFGGRSPDSFTCESQKERGNYIKIIDDEFKDLTRELAQARLDLWVDRSQILCVVRDLAHNLCLIMSPFTWPARIVFVRKKMPQGSHSCSLPLERHKN